MIEIDDLTIAVPGRTLVRNITASIGAGEFIGVLGANGVGKTTLLRTLCGFHPASGGAVRIDGSDHSTLTSRERARRIAYVTADDALTDALTVRDVVAIGRYAHHRWWQWNPNADDEASVERALAAVGMSAWSGRLFATLSSGERQRVWIGMGVAQAAPIVLLDEPTSHLDVRVAHSVLTLLRKLAHDGTTIVCVMHDLNDAAAYADRIMLLGCERVLAVGTPREVLQAGLVEQAYGIAMEPIVTRYGVRIFPVSTSVIDRDSIE